MPKCWTSTAVASAYRREHPQIICSRQTTPPEAVRRQPQVLKIKRGSTNRPAKAIDGPPGAHWKKVLEDGGAAYMRYGRIQLLCTQDQVSRFPTAIAHLVTANSRLPCSKPQHAVAGRCAL